MGFALIAVRAGTVSIFTPGLDPVGARQPVLACRARDPMGAADHVALCADAGGVEIGCVDAPLVPVQPGRTLRGVHMTIGTVALARYLSRDASIEDHAAVVRKDRAGIARRIVRVRSAATDRPVGGRGIGCAIAHRRSARTGETVGSAQTSEPGTVTTAAASQRRVLEDIIGRAACDGADRAGHALDDLATGGVANDALDRSGLALDRLGGLVVGGLRCLRDLHGTAADQRTAASACAEFRQSHLHRHSGQSQPVRRSPRSARRYIS